MFIALQDIYIIIYLLIEQYVFERVIEMRMKEQVEFFLMVEELKVSDCTMERDIVSNLAPNEESNGSVENKHMEYKPEVSELDVESITFLEDLQKELGTVTTENEITTGEQETNDMYSYTDEDVPPTDHNNYAMEPYFAEEDLLSIDDIHDEPVESIPEPYPTIATAKISDDLDGVQQWVVNVVGIEGNFIHVSDGSRMWLNVGESYAARINKGNVLAIDINKVGRKVDVKHIMSLETGVSEDYSIPDEMRYEFSDLQDVI